MQNQQNKVYEDGRWWYKWKGKRQALDNWQKQNETRMWVGGEYVSRKHPLFKPGRYATFEDAWSHTELDTIEEGHVYIVSNPAWPEWVKIGMAVDAHDRARSLQTGSPYRDYTVEMFVKVKNKRKTESSAHRLCDMVCEERRGEWFKMPVEQARIVVEALVTG